MIPTKIKQKLPKTLSWPVRAAAISAGLAGRPHVQEFTLWFRDSPVWRASELQKMLRDASPYAVLFAEYTPRTRIPYSGSKELDALGMNDARWEVHINPVPRSWRATVATLIRENGLPAVAEWLQAFTGEGWQSRHHRVELIFSPADGTLSKQTRKGNL